MDSNTTRIFEEIAKQFISQTLGPRGSVHVDILSVKVASQSIIKVSGDPQRRVLQDSPDLQISDLQVEIDITGEVTPYKPPDSFSFHSTVLYGFVNNFATFKTDLAAASTFFAIWGGSEIQSRSVNPSSGMNPTYIAFILLIIVVVAVSSGLVFSVIYIKKKQREEVEGFRHQVQMLNLASHSSAMSPYSHGISLPDLPISPNTMEIGGFDSGLGEKSMSYSGFSSQSGEDPLQVSYCFLILATSPKHFFIGLSS
jgi:hypothetical protein